MKLVLRWSSTAYRNLLWMCPHDLRRDFGEEMALVFADDLAGAWLESGFSGVCVVWARAVVELLWIGLSAAAAARGAAASAMTAVLAAVCLGGEILLIRAQAPFAPAAAPVTIGVVVLSAFLTAAAVSFAAVRISTGADPLTIRVR